MLEFPVRTREDLLDLYLDLRHQKPIWWVTVVDFLQHHWALPVRFEQSTVLLFVDDMGRIFDSIEYPDEQAAQSALRLNKFDRFDKSRTLQRMMRPPRELRGFRNHSKGLIYSSGRYWKS